MRHMNGKQANACTQTSLGGKNRRPHLAMAARHEQRMTIVALMAFETTMIEKIKLRHNKLN